MSFGVVEGEVSSGTDVQGLTVAEIEGHPFGQITFSGQRWALADVRLLSPILPSKVVCVGRNRPKLDQAASKARFGQAS